jgi:hypothetical protein
MTGSVVNNGMSGGGWYLDFWPGEADG